MNQNFRMKKEEMEEFKMLVKNKSILLGRRLGWSEIVRELIKDWVRLNK